MGNEILQPDDCESADGRAIALLPRCVNKNNINQIQNEEDGMNWLPRCRKRKDREVKTDGNRYKKTVYS